MVILAFIIQWESALSTTSFLGLLYITIHFVSPKAAAGTDLHVGPLKTPNLFCNKHFEKSTLAILRNWLVNIGYSNHKKRVCGTLSKSIKRMPSPPWNGFCAFSNQYNGKLRDPRKILRNEEKASSWISPPNSCATRSFTEFCCRNSGVPPDRLAAFKDQRWSVD